MYYFKSLFDLSYQRSKGQALVYSLFVFLMSIIVTLIVYFLLFIALKLTTGADLQSSYYLQFTVLMSIVSVWSLMIFYYKRLSYFPWFLVALSSPFLVLHAPGNAIIIAGFVPIAILSMLKSRCS